MLITTSCMKQITKKSFPDHLHHCHHIPAVTNILQNHHRHTGLFVGIDQVPALFQGIRSRYLHACILAGTHGIDRHTGMPEPWGCDNDSIHIASLQHLPVCICISTIGFHFWMTLFIN